jgi:hypothetical protein
MATTSLRLTVVYTLRIVHPGGHCMWASDFRERGEIKKKRKDGKMKKKRHYRTETGIKKRNRGKRSKWEMMKRIKDGRKEDQKE